jgi:energy-coupling factor transporter ATP-binding protein EcfA2
VTYAPSDRITYLGRTNSRNSGLAFGIKQADRRVHLLVTGKTGSGKSHFLKLIAEQDAQAGNGFALFDPHGDLALSVQHVLPEDRRPELVYVDVSDATCRWRFNPFAGVSVEKQPLAAAGIVEVFKKLWLEDWGPRLEHLLRNVAYTLLATEGATFADVPELLSNRTYRLEIARQLRNETVRDFWTNEFDKYTTGLRAMVIAPLQNKVGALLTDPVLRRFFTEEGDRLDLRRLMDDGKILIMNLDKGRIGEGPCALLGSLILSHLALAGLSRSDTPEEERRDFSIILDEFQTFTTQSLVNMLSELRKYRCSLVLAHQHLSQLDHSIRDAVFGNVGSIVSFRVGAADAQYLAREFAPRISPEDLVSLPRYHIYVKLLIDGQPSQPFSAETLETLPQHHADS